MNGNKRLSVFDRLKKNGGLADEFTISDLRKAYKRASLKHHPDKGGDPEIMKKITDVFSGIEKEYKNTENNALFIFNRITREIKSIKPVNIDKKKDMSQEDKNKKTSKIFKNFLRYMKENQERQAYYKKKNSDRPSHSSPSRRSYSPKYFDTGIYKKIIIRVGLLTLLIIVGFTLVRIGRRWIIRKFYRVVPVQKTKKKHEITTTKKTK